MNKKRFFQCATLADRILWFYVERFVL